MDTEIANTDSTVTESIIFESMKTQSRQLLKQDFKRKFLIMKTISKVFTIDRGKYI